jgi:hypothetical protein
MSLWVRNFIVSRAMNGSWAAFQIGAAALVYFSGVAVGVLFNELPILMGLLAIGTAIAMTDFEK